MHELISASSRLFFLRLKSNFNRLKIVLVDTDRHCMQCIQLFMHRQPTINVSHTSSNAEMSLSTTTLTFFKTMDDI